MNLYYKSYGAGPSVLILHGLFGMLDNWQTFARRLADSFTVYAIDLRNHGRSPHNSAFDYPTLAGDIVEFISQHKLVHVDVIGHSLGGKVAMQTALSHPHLIDHLMVVDISPRAYESGHDAIIEALLGTDLSLLKTRRQIEQALINKLHDKEVVLFLMKNVARHKDGSFFWRMNLPVLAEKYSNTMSSVEARAPFEKPTIFVRGGRSNYIRDRDWPDILDLFPNAELRTIEHAGHWVHADAMEELLVETRKLFSV